MAVVHAFVYTTGFLEKYILGLTYEVRGKEHLPNEGSFIVAAKHQSAYETLKLHILFNDPAVVLKQELLKIPLWGRYLHKSDVIAIDRSSPKAAIKSMQEGAKHVASHGRPIVIFPQGTRVSPKTIPKEKPYKIGIVRMQEATNLPIIPMALNSGVFYPKNAWIKKPGRVVFEFLPSIMPDGDNTTRILKQIEMELEDKSRQLEAEGRKSIPVSQKGPRAVAASILILISLYTINWYVAAEITKKSVNDFLGQLKEDTTISNYQPADPKIYGFPGKLKLFLPKQTHKTQNQEVSINFIKAESWPILGMPIDIQTGEITISMTHWKKAISFSSFDARITYKNSVLSIKHGTLNANATQGQVSGQVDFSAPSSYPTFDLDLKLTNIEPFLSSLVERGVVMKKAASFAKVALRAFQREGTISSTITSDKNKIYLGPIKIIEFSPIEKQAATLENGQPSAYALKRVKPKPRPAPDL